MSMPHVVEESRPVKVIVAALCGYETVAITTGLFPTVTRLHRDHPIIGVAIISALVWHFLPPKGA